MSPSARARPDPSIEPLTPEMEAAVKAASSWVQQFARTLKTCRLYDAGNPTVVRFRQELHQALERLIEDHGALTLRFTADDVLIEEVSVLPARSREDNLALAFYRDGVRTLSFSAGIEAYELNRLIDCVIRVTAQSTGEDDLVTLLWEAHLHHIEVDYVPGEADTGGNASAEGAGETVPWPTSAAFDEVEPAAGEESQDPAITAHYETETEEASERSDDWSVGENTAEVEAGFEELQALVADELARFQGEYEEERKRSTAGASIAMARACLASGIETEDRLEVGRFIPRVLRLAFVQGRWSEALEALQILAECGNQDWSMDTFAQELLQPISIAGIKERLDDERAEIDQFIAFASALGEPGVDLLCHMLAEQQTGRFQKPLSEAIVRACRDNPERIAHWVGDSRAFVVRGMVQVLGAIGGPAILGPLSGVVDHTDPRVRQEVVAALRGIEPRQARPLLLKLLEGADTRMFCQVLHQLSQSRDPATTRLLIATLQDPEFEQRPTEEKRAVYSALGSTGGDEALAELEAELHKGGWFSRGDDPHRQAIARCIVRIGTPAAKTVLERGVQSRRTGLRKVCEEALTRWKANE